MALILIINYPQQQPQRPALQLIPPKPPLKLIIVKIQSLQHILIISHVVQYHPQQELTIPAVAKLIPDHKAQISINHHRDA